MARDPISRFRAVLEDDHGVDPAALDALDAEIKAEVAEAVRFARESPFPEPAEAFDDLYATRTAPAI